jgi:transposase
LLSQLELLVQDIQQYDREIERLVKSHPDSEIFLALKGVGTNPAARIMVEFGDDRTHAEGRCRTVASFTTQKSGDEVFTNCGLIFYSILMYHY